MDAQLHENTAPTGDNLSATDIQTPNSPTSKLEITSTSPTQELVSVKSYKADSRRQYD
jgi:hypothetical protein